MTSMKTIPMACILVALLALRAASTVHATVLPPSTSTIQCGKWNVVSSPPIDNLFSQLNAVSAVSTTDVWAVGFSANSTQTLIEHWNGTSWQIVSSPNPAVMNTLNGIATLSAQNVWAVGSSASTSGVQQTLVEHWNGKKWSVVPSPNPPNSLNDALLSVSASSASDIWAVGYYGMSSGRPQYTLTEHWNGNTWSIVPSPTIDKQGGASTDLYGVTAISPTNAWAVGFDNVGNFHAVIEHWDGHYWHIRSHPHISAQLGAVTSVSASDVWAVGDAVGAQPLADHWNGKHWSFVPTPSRQGFNFLDGVAARGANDIWSVGWLEPVKGHKTITEHWNGKRWQLVDSPNPSHDTLFFGVAMASSHQVWAVGTYEVKAGGTYNPLIEYYC